MKQEDKKQEKEIIGRKIGYCRVSTEDQKLDLQLHALKEYGVQERDIFQEKISGTKRQRPELDAMLQYIQKGDTVVVWKLDRLGRSLMHLNELMQQFKERGINFVSIKENIDTTTAVGKLIFNLIGSISEFERDMLVERTKAGLAAAKKNGKFGGRPVAEKTKVQTALDLYETGKYSVKEVCEKTGVARTTFYRYKDKKKLEE